MPPSIDGSAGAAGAMASSDTAPAAMVSRPAAIAAGPPIRASTRGPRNEPTITAALNGGNSSPASDRRQPEHLLRVQHAEQHRRRAGSR